VVSNEDAVVEAETRSKAGMPDEAAADTCTVESTADKPTSEPAPAKATMEAAAAKTTSVNRVGSHHGTDERDGS
jgi:hypothetical protein